MHLKADSLAGFIFSFSYFQLCGYKHRSGVSQEVVYPDKHKWERGNEADGICQDVLDFDCCRDKLPY